MKSSTPFNTNFIPQQYLCIKFQLQWNLCFMFCCRCHKTLQNKIKNILESYAVFGRIQKLCEPESRENQQFVFTAK